MTENQAANLRRLDWRFLLPLAPHQNFKRLLLSGGPAGLDNLIIKTGMAESVLDRIPSGCQVDAAVLLRDSLLDMEQAIAALSPRGVLYLELERRNPLAFLNTPERIRRKLMQSGLTTTGIYWAAPNFEHCQRYIPLDVPGVIRWYLSSLFVAGTPIHWLIKLFLYYMIGNDSRRMELVAPCLSIAAVVGSENNVSPSVLNVPQLQGVFTSKTQRPMLLTSGQDDASRLILYPFCDEPGQLPSAVVKIASHPAFNAETVLEQEVLREVRTRVDPKLRQSIPVPLGEFDYCHSAVAVESCATGRSIWSSSGGWSVSPQQRIIDMKIATDWLTEFHCQTQVEHLIWNQAATEQWVQHPLTAYTRDSKVTTAEKKLFTELYRRALDLNGITIPLVWQHNDYAPWNLYVAGTKLTVIDWECNRPLESIRSGPPLCDLLYFVTYWYYVVAHLYSAKAERQGLYELLLEPEPKNQYVRTARGVIIQYMSALKIDPRLFSILLVFTWLEKALYHEKRQKKLGRCTGKANRGKYRNYVRILAGHSEQLFALGNGNSWLDEPPEAQLSGKRGDEPEWFPGHRKCE